MVGVIDIVATNHFSIQQYNKYKIMKIKYTPRSTGRVNHQKLINILQNYLKGDTNKTK